MYDLVIKGGTCFDGLGNDGVLADVAVSDGVIVETGRVDGQARETIDATGHFVAPGFIDGHTHLDAQLFWDPYAGSLVEHGVTSAVIGNCGFTLAPGSVVQADLVIRSIERAEDMSRAAIERGVPWTWSDFEGYAGAVDDLPKALNVAVQIGHSALRASVMGERAFGEAATEDDLVRMEREVRNAMAAGAWGFSTSRSHAHATRSGDPVASRSARWEEVSRLVMAMAACGTGIFQLAPERDEDPSKMADFQTRLRDLAVASRRLVTFMVGGQEQQLATIEGVVGAGGACVGQVHVRRFENIFGFRTRLPFDVLPAWREVRGKPYAEQQDLLTRDDVRHRLVEEAEHCPYGEAIGAEVRAPRFDRITVINGAEDAERSVADLAAARGVSAVEEMIDLALSSQFDQLFRQSINDVPTELILAGLRHPHTVVAASDSGAHISQILDSNIPTYLLSHWVRTKEVFGWPEAISMLTGRPAAVWGLDRRGTLALGGIADVVVFDPGTVGCEAPRVVNDLPDGGPRLAQSARGMKSVVVHGEEVLRDGTPTGACPGELLRSGPNRRAA